MLLFLGNAWAAVCAEPVAIETLETRLADAEAAFADLRVEDFRVAADETALLLECLSAPVTVELAGRFHRLQGLRLFVARDEEDAVRAFAAARSVAPGLPLGDDLVPPGHELRDLWEHFPLEDGRTETVGRPAAGRLLFDGTETNQRPQAWPTIVQLEDDAGVLTDTAWVRPKEALPVYRVSPFDEGGKARKPVKGALLGTGAVATIGAGFLYGLAAASAASFDQDHPDWTSEDLSRQRTKTNSLVFASAATGGVAVVTLGLGFALR